MFWSQTPESILSTFKTDSKLGLSDLEAASRLNKFGRNVLNLEPDLKWWQILGRQFQSSSVYLLFAASLLLLFLGERLDALAIFSILVVNGLVGFQQEIKSHRSISSLKKLTIPQVRVLRSGQVISVPSDEVVPGDIVLLEAGDIVTADIYLLSTFQFSINESALTGESLPIEKAPGPLPAETSLGDRTNMVFSGTSCMGGSAQGVVVATGMETELGKVADLIKGASSGTSPLQARLLDLNTKLLYFCLVSVGIISALGYLRGFPILDVLMTGVSLAVAAIPEGLPAVVTLALALAMGRMARKKAIIRKLSAVETLGSTDVICSDKTGTLTTGKVTLVSIHSSGQKFNLEDSRAHQLIGDLVLTANLAKSTDPIDLAIHQASRFLTEKPELPELSLLWSFDSDRKRMSVGIPVKENLRILTKGAPESIFEICSIDPVLKQDLEKLVSQYSAQGMKVLAFSHRTIKMPNRAEDLTHKDVEKEHTFSSLLLFTDPPRPEVKNSIAICRNSGIKVVMITGDHPQTALAIARELELSDKLNPENMITGAELEKLSEADFLNRVENIFIYARVSPAQKIRIVEAWKSKGKTVAMTGDGVNDAPALKAAHIGVAMGLSGTEVAKEASSMVLADDHFHTIVVAITEGRAVFGNIRRTILYLFSGNLSEIFTVLLSTLFGFPTPFAPIQLLWINLVTDGLPALALASEPISNQSLETRSRPNPNLVDRGFLRELAFVSVISSVSCLIIFWWALKTHGVDTAKTMAFTFLVFNELMRSFASRNEQIPVLKLGLTGNIFHVLAVLIPLGFQILILNLEILQKFFKTTPLSSNEVVSLFALSLVPLVILEFRKHYFYKTPRFS